MAEKFDNIKMWESLLGWGHLGVPKEAITSALKDQGFTWDGEHIVPINPEPLKIEKGKWYMCINQFHNWIEGEIYTSINDGRIIDYFGNEYDMQSDASEYFRPATEKEIEALRRNEQNVDQNPKFKVGDLVVWDGFCHLIQKISPDGYICKEGLIEFSDENNLHLWSIQDAKDGDVLVNDFNMIFIFKEVKNDIYISHCSVIDRENDVIINSIAEREVGNVGIVKVLPATQEQRELLFAKMKEAGYEWDAEKNELKTIEQKPVEWSEEDEKIVSRLHNIIFDCLTFEKFRVTEPEYSKLYDWLKSLKDRYLPQQKQEWSEKDKEIWQDLLNWFGDADEDFHFEFSEIYDWLKSLRPQKQWKPSEEQLKALDFAIDCTVYPEFNIQRSVLKELLEQLKKLREE